MSAVGVSTYSAASTSELGVSNFEISSGKDAGDNDTKQGRRDRSIEAFKEIDDNNNGFLDASEMLSHLQKEFPDKNITKEAVREMMDEADEAHNGKISLEEFINMMEKVHSGTAKSSLWNNVSTMQDHIWEHKHKYALGTVTIVGIVLVVIFTVVLVAVSTSNSNDDSAVAAAVRSAVTATKIATVSIIPAKGSSSSRRRKLEMTQPSANSFSSIFDISAGATKFLENMKGSANNRNNIDPSSNLRRRLQTVVPHTALPALSDYNQQPDATEYVAEDAASAVNMVNMIGCYMDQLKITEIGINEACNPGSKPYVAMVQNSACESDNSAFSTWYVDYNGPSGLGDGVYSGNALFDMNGMKISLKMSSTMTGGALVSTQVNYFMTGDFTGSGTIMQQGGFFRETQSGGNAELYFMSHMASDITAAVASGGLMGDSLYAMYNPSTFTGKAFTTVTDYDTGTKNKYQLQISTNAIYKRTTPIDSSGNLGTPVEVCVDFRETSQMMVANSYYMYNAQTGVALAYLDGFPVKQTVTAAMLSATPTLKGVVSSEAYLSYWGLYINNPFNTTSGEYISDTNTVSAINAILFGDSVTVEKTNYAGGAPTQYTLKLSPGRMNKISMKSVTLGEIKGLPLTVNNWGSSAKGDIIKWTGTDFVKVGSSGRACVNVDKTNNYAQTTIANSIGSYKECSCFDTTTNSVSTSMTPKDWSTCTNDCRNTESYTKLAGANATSTTTYPVDSTSFSRGMDVKTAGDVLYGQVKLAYEPVVSLYGVNPGSYTKGQTVTQTYTSGGASVTATGTVHKSTPSGVFGLSCSSCITMTPQNFGYSSCAASGTPTTGQSLPPGTTLTQNTGGSTVVAVVPEYSYISDWSSVPVVFITGSAFVPGTNIVASWNADNAKSAGVTMETYYTDVTGTITWTSTTGIANVWDGLTYNSVNCTGSGSVNFAIPTGVTGASVTVGTYTDSSGNLKWYGYTSAQGSSCNSISPYQMTASDFTGSGISCTTYPMLNVKCNQRVESSSRDVDVLLPSATATAFTKCWDETCPVTINNVNVGSNYWKQTKQGNIQTISDSTELVYRQQSVVMPGTTVPSLKCYENCPTLTTSTGLSEFATYDSPSVLDTNPWISTDGDCTIKPISVTFANIGGSPTANLTWTETGKSPTSYYLQAFELTNLGSVCTSSATPTVTFNGGTCSVTPVVTLSCDTNHDAADGAQGKSYTFSDITGAITDVATSNPALAITSYGSYGPFFEATPANLAKLKCDWNDALLCSYGVWEQLSEFYLYEAGPNSQRPTLIDSNNNAVVFGSPKMMHYTHSGTTSNSGKNFDNTQFLFEYHGNGELRGLPVMCIDKSTGLPGNCYPGSSDEIQEITIPATGILTDIDTNIKYYTKPSELGEYYPYYTTSAGALSTTECTNAGLSFETYQEIDTQWSTMYERPDWYNQDFPTSAVKSSTYFMAGVPAVVKSVPVYEQDGMNGLCPNGATGAV